MAADSSFPARSKSERTLLLIGFRHDDQSALDGWRDGLKLLDTDGDGLEVPVVPVTSPLVQPMIRSGMRRKFATAAQRAHIAILFAAPASTAVAFGDSPDAPAVIVLDHTERALVRAEGAYDIDKAGGLMAVWRTR